MGTTSRNSLSLVRKGDVRIRDQVEMDSMDFLDIIMQLRKRYDIEVPEEDYMNLATLDGAVAYLDPRMDHLWTKRHCGVDSSTQRTARWS
jgi:acyl carrier protein